MEGNMNNPANKIKITIKSLNGTKSELFVPENESIRSIKLQLQEIEGIDHKQLRLIFKGKLLTDTDSLSTKKIKDGDLIHSAIMLRGGMLSLYHKNRGRRGKKPGNKEAAILKKSPGAMRAQVDLDELDFEDLPNCSLEVPHKEDIQHFIVNIKIDTRESFWYGGTFAFKFEIPNNYPYEAPKVTAMQHIYHPNISTKGSICLNLLSKDWTPILTVQQVIHGLIFLFLQPNPDDPLNGAPADVMRKDMALFKRNVTASLNGKYVDGVQYQKLL